jgi:hypothetical protein
MGRDPFLKPVSGIRIYDFILQRWDTYPLTSSYQPKPRWGAGWEARAGILYLWGGEDFSGPINDIWMLDFSKFQWRPLHLNFGIELANVDARMYPGFLSADSIVIPFASSARNQIAYFHLASLSWTFVNHRWNFTHVETGKTVDDVNFERRNYGIVYDADQDTAILMYGMDNKGVMSNAVFQLSVSSGMWDYVPTSANETAFGTPDGRRIMAVAKFDNTVVMFGGAWIVSGQTEMGREMWFLDLSDWTWHLIWNSTQYMYITPRDTLPIAVLRTNPAGLVGEDVVFAIFGGWGRGPFYNDLFLVNATRDWKTLLPLSERSVTHASPPEVTLVI